MIFDKELAKDVVKRINRGLLYGAEFDISDDSLSHVGVGHLDGGHSGRFPWGSGENPHQHYKDFSARWKALREQGMSEIDAAKALGCFNAEGKPSTQALRDTRNALRAASDYYVVSETKRMLEQGKSIKDIADALGESTQNIRQYAKEDRLAKAEATKAVVDYLREQVDAKGVVEVGGDVEKYPQLNISRDKFRMSLKLLQEEGYEVYGGRVPQPTNPGKQTTITVLCKPGTPKSVVYRNRDLIKPLDDSVLHVDENGNDIIKPKWQYPASLDSSRVYIRYPDEGGSAKDGLVEIRRGVPDLNLKNHGYAQVRIMVDGTHYIKGVAAYSDDVPEGYDIVVNTSKSREEKVFGRVFKGLKTDPDDPTQVDKTNPFGALLREEEGQSTYTDKDGTTKLSVINVTKYAGDVDQWTKSLPSQFLAKQPIELITRQLNMATANASAEFAEIMSLTNPNLKKHFLMEFARSCDRDAVDLAGAPLPGQRYQILMPAPTLKDNEVYAPNFPEGSKIALVRFPHAGTYEIPILTVTHRNAEAKNLIGPNAKDAVCLNKTNLEKLSGADCDGDTAMCIPCNTPDTHVTIVNRERLKGLENFDPHVEYAIAETDEKTPRMKYQDKNGKWHDNTQREMGIISNLITDMTIQGATDDELAAATRHSMVVIDAAKHSLDYKRSERENNIAALKKKYQRHVDPETGEIHYGGSATILSLAKSPTHPQKTYGEGKIDANGNLVYKLDNRTVKGRDGVERVRLRTSNRMMDTQDAATLSAGYEKEVPYVVYANAMKQLARDARLAAEHTENRRVDYQAKETYSAEVQSLADKVTKASLNNPRERLAIIATNDIVDAKMKAARENGVEMTKKDSQKLRQITLTRMRDRYGAARAPLEVTPKEWEAIQAGAVSVDLFDKVMRYAGDEQLRQLAMPKKDNRQIGAAKIAQIRAWARSGYSNAEIAKQLGISISTVLTYLPGGKA